MDLTQNKLNYIEWNNIEVPVSEQEKSILKIIIDGYDNVNIRYNTNLSLISVVKIDKTPENELYLYKAHFQDLIREMMEKYGEIIGFEYDATISTSTKIRKLKSSDMIRIQNMDTNIKHKSDSIIEFIQLDFCDKMLKSFAATKQPIINMNQKIAKNKKTTKNEKSVKPEIPEKSHEFYLYTLLQMKKTSINNLNPQCCKFVDAAIEFVKSFINISNTIYQSHELIEKNPYIIKYEDYSLFSHQKQLFSICKMEKPTPKLILYMAPTGTGKTLSPIGLMTDYKVIFVCVARHIGLALAKSAISMEKRIAFAFGCETASDIRLHYYAASNYTRNYRSGGIHKVDNSVGDKVDMIICDVKSYLIAMRYMLAFNKGKEQSIITYWDEPTITMDSDSHDLHDIIHENWVENKIPNMVLSCATLPKESEMADTITDFCSRFENAQIHTINSYDCRKTISMVNKNGYCVLPHLAFESYPELQQCVEHCNQNKSLLRYFDLSEITKFIEYVMSDKEYLDEAYSVPNYFDDDISNITMNSVKIYYLDILKHISRDKWPEIYNHCIEFQIPKFKENMNRFHKTTSLDNCKKFDTSSSNLVRSNSIAIFTSSGNTLSNIIENSPPTKEIVKPNNLSGALLTTEDAHTLTDGPTIFLTDDVDKIGKFYIQQSNIPKKVFDTLMERIEKNNDLQKKIDNLQKSLEDQLGSEIEKSKKMEKEQFKGDVHVIMNEIARLKNDFNMVSVDSVYIPNTKQHQQLWAPNGKLVENAFVPEIEESVVKDIMLLNVNNQMKLLLLLGIGTFVNKPNVQYMEIMKKLAYEQKLYIIIASSDYIYGTNYQFCHGFIAKDLINMTQQKIIQAMGRIGRNNIQQEYSIRFRDDGIISQLLLPPKQNIEAIVISRLFST
jgi:hypothetical protein